MTGDQNGATPSGTAEIGNWLPSPCWRVQHRLSGIAFGEPQLRTPCGAVVVTYRSDDPRVPWPSWPRCPECRQATVRGA